MAGYYVYLISSLPTLHFGARPPFSFEQFISRCRNLIPDKKLKVLEGCLINGDYTQPTGEPALVQWRAFDTALRNELVRIRAGRRHVDPAGHLRGDGYAEPHIMHAAINAYRNTSILEAERELDLARWRELDGISAGRYFDQGFLVCYAHKLLILHRWENINTADNKSALEAVLTEN